MAQSGPGNIVALPAQPQDNPPAVAFIGNARGKKALETFANRQGDKADGKPTDNIVEQRSFGVLPALVRQAWVRNYRARELVDYRLLVNLRARRAQYSPQDLNLYTRNGVGPPYLPLAAVKMRQAEAAIAELITPDGDRPWSFEPNPVPTLPETIVKGVQEKAFAEAQKRMAEATQGGTPMALPQYFEMETQVLEQLHDQAMEAFRKEARERAARMEDVIDSELRRGGYYQAMRDFASHFTTFPTAILKGPYKKRITELEWVGNTPKQRKRNVCYWSAVNPFDVYPAPQARTAQDGEFIERMRFTRADLFSMIGLEGYDEPAIRRILAFKVSGNLQSWLWSDIQRREIEAYTTDIWKPEYFIDALHYWGSVSGTDLIQHGIVSGVSDPLAYYEVDAILVDNEIIRCEINSDPLARRPYWNASYDPVPGAFWGNSIFDLMEDCQGLANAAVRAMNANFGLAAGPIMGIDISKMADGEDPKSLAPLDVIQLDTGRSPTSDAQKAIIFWQADSRANELIGIIDRFKQESDELTGIPRYSYGGGASDLRGGAATASGLESLLNQADKGLRRSIAEIDRNVVEPTLKMAYQDYMQNGEDEFAKGDCAPVARGSGAVLVKQHKQQVMIQLLGLMANPQDSQIFGLEGRRKVWEQALRVMDMPVLSLVPSEEELSQRLQQQSGPPQPDANAQLKAKVQMAEISSKERQAQERAGIALAKALIAKDGVLPIGGGGLQGGPLAPAPQAQGIGAQVVPQQQQPFGAAPGGDDLLGPGFASQ